MPPRSRFARQVVSALGILIVCCAAVFGWRGNMKPYSPDAPDYRVKGRADAPVVIVEYSDFQCPACRVAVGPLKSILRLYGEDVRVVFKHFPWDFHEHARAGARAAECAGRQGKFWEYHDQLYDHQREWTEGESAEFLTGYAKELELDGPAFAACVNDPSVEAALVTDIEEGDNQWVNSTPTFFINGKRFVGARQLSTRGMIHIEREIKKRKGS